MSIAALIANVMVFWATVLAIRRGVLRPRVVLVVLVLGIAVIQAIALNFHLEQGLLARPTVYPWPAGWSGYPELGLLAVVQLAILLAALHAAISWWQRLALLGLVATNVIELAFLFSRLAWVAGLGITLAAGIVALRARRLTTLAPAFALMFLIGGLLLGANPTLGRLAASLAGDEAIGEATASQRFDIWRRTGRMIQDYALTGVGIGNFRAVYEPRYNPQLNPDGRRGVHAHNLWLHQTAELGLFGGAAYLAIWVAALVIAWKRASSSFVDEAVFYVILAIAIRSVGDNMFFSVSGASARLHTLTWMCFGLLCRTDRGATSSQASDHTSGHSGGPHPPRQSG